MDSRRPANPVARKVAAVVGWPVLIGAAVAGPVGLLLGPAHWRAAAVGFGLCVPTGVGVVFLADRLDRVSPFGKLLAMAAGTLVRLLVGFGGAAAVFVLAGPEPRPERIAFWLWVLFAYLVTLAVETAVLAGFGPTPAGRPVPPKPNELGSGGTGLPAGVDSGPAGGGHGG